MQNKKFNPKVSGPAAEELIAWSVKNDPDSLKTILQRNGVNTENLKDTKGLLVAVISANKNLTFRKDLIQLLSKHALNNPNDFTEKKVGVAGLADLTALQGDQMNSGGTSSDGNKAGTTSSSKGSTSKTSFGDFLKTNVLTKDNINAFINTGLTALNTSMQNKSANIQMKAAELQAMNNQSAGINTNTGVTTKKSNTALIVGLSVVAVAVVGFGIYYAVKK